MSGVTRRGLLGMVGATGATLAATGLSSCASGDRDEAVADGGSGSVIHPFRDVAHQAGVTAPLTSAATVVALDVRAEDRAELAETFRTLSDSIEHVMSGEAYVERDGGYPAFDTGIVRPGPTSTSVVVGYGASLFDERFGLADRKPAELRPMDHFVNDYLVTDERSHGDLVLSINADSHEAVVHALRQILRETRGDVIPRWSREGFNHLRPDAGPGEAPGRNLLGFLDGTANLDVGDDALMDDVVWIGAGDEPEWAVGGTYQAIRIIRMMTEFWDRTRLNEQEELFGRHRASGAPLGMEHETDTPVFDDDALANHIARANPRLPGTERNLILRRGFNYADGFDENDQLDQGLIFTSFQRSLDDGFVTVQRRLDGEALEEYIRPIGGGFYVVGPPPQGDEYLGERLLA